MSPSALEIDQLSLRAGGRSVVDQVSFRALPGEVTAVIGPNGAGKTSLFEAIVGLRETAAGTVRVAAQPLRSFALRARTFAYLPDQCELAAEARASTLIEHALSCATGSVDVAELRDLLTIEPLAALGAGVLSRGERQRLLLFCTLALGRPVVVLDEPFSAFDPLQLRDVRRAVRSIASAGATVLASVHQLADVETIADRVLLMAEGRKIAFGTLAALREQAGSGAATLEEVFLTLLARKTHAA